jgi:RNA-directed DNA polymerase
VIRYADDLVALCHNQRQAEQVKARLAGWLAPRGLVFNDDKTKIVHLSAGFDFLGFSVRRYGDTLLIKPSVAAIQRIRERLRTEMRALRGANAAAVLVALTPIIRGWAAYYRGVVATKTFKSLDSHLWTLTYRWASRRHPNKPKRWVAARYFGKFNKFRNDHWVFGDAASGAYLVKFSWTDIVRHIPVTGRASPDDPALAEYWATRRRRIKPPLDSYTLRLLTKQGGRCPLCGDELLCAEQPPQSPRDWERWWLHVTRKAIVADYLVHHGRPRPADGDHTRLVHAACRREHLARHGRNPAVQPRAAPGLA